MLQVGATGIEEEKEEEDIVALQCFCVTVTIASRRR
jgi:hypothetical protein